MEDLGLLVLGILLLVVGFINLKGNIKTIHFYNRRRIKEENIPKYGKLMGIGFILMGLGLIIAYVLKVTGYGQYGEWAAIPGLIVGIGLILFTQIKYNRGIF